MDRAQGVDQTNDDAEFVARVAALDIGKAEVVCCVRMPGPDGSRRREQQVRTFSAMTRSLTAMADWLAGLGDPGGDGSYVGLLEAAVLCP